MTRSGMNSYLNSCTIFGPYCVPAQGASHLRSRNAHQRVWRESECSQLHWSCLQVHDYLRGGILYVYIKQVSDQTQMKNGHAQVKTAVSACTGKQHCNGRPDTSACAIAIRFLCRPYTCSARGCWSTRSSPPRARSRCELRTSQQHQSRHQQQSNCRCKLIHCHGSQFSRLRPTRRITTGL